MDMNFVLLQEFIEINALYLNVSDEKVKCKHTNML